MNVFGSCLFPRQDKRLYSQYLCHQAATLAKTIGIFRRNLETIDEFSSWEQLKMEVVSAVEAEIQNNLTDYEVNF